MPEEDAAPRDRGAPDAAPPPPSAGTRVGEIEVLRPLGAGGMGHVVVARDHALGREVAVKFLHASLLGDERARRRFLREGRTLAQIRSPHVVSVHSVGAHEGWPYIVMELIEGPPLARRLQGRTLAWESALDVLEQVARALAVVHAAGLVHRDVKPENIVLREREGTECLIDFGLARVVDGRSTTSSGVAGTPYYMAPERLWGTAGDARADVYSAGVVLYEMLTGHVPHHDVPEGAFYRRVLFEDDVPSVAGIPGLPRAVEQLVARCLARAPELRPHDGAALLEAVRAARAQPAARESAAVWAIAAPNDPSEELPLLGRDDVYRAAVDAVEAAAAGSGGCLLVEGSPGEGKSRLVRETERAARARALRVLRCHVRERAGPYEPIRALLAETGEASDFAPLGDAYASVLGALSRADRAGGSLPGPSPVARSLLAWLRRLMVSRPLCLSVDDAHLADEATLDVLVQLAESAHALPFVLVMSSLPGQWLGPESIVRARLSGLEARRDVTTLVLEPLQVSAVQQLLRVALHLTDTEAARHAATLHAKSGGNALYLAECLRSLEESGEVRRDTQGDRALRTGLSRLGIPPRMLDLALRRIAALSPQERDALDVVSIDPQGVPAALVARCLEVSDLTARRLLQRLVAARGLVEERGEEFLVAHSEIRGAAYGELTDSIRRAYHFEAATLLLAAGGDRKDPGRVGRHFLAGGRRDEAAPLLLSAAKQHRDAHAPAQSLALYDAAIACDSTPVSDEARVGRAGVLELLGELDHARAELEQVARSEGPARVAALTQLAEFECRRGEDAVALRHVEAALDAALAPADELLVRILELTLAVRADRHADAARIASRARELAPHGADDRQLRLAIELGLAAWARGDAPGAIQEFAGAVAFGERIGAQDNVIRALFNLSLAAVDVGRRDDALAWATQATERAVQVGSEYTLLFCRLNLTGLLIDAGRLGDAAMQLDSARTQLPVVRSREAEYTYHARVAELALARGAPPDALAAARAGIALVSDSPHNEIAFRSLEARALHRLGDRTAALEALERGRDLLGSAGTERCASELDAVQREVDGG